MSSSGGPPGFKTIWDLSTSELEVLKNDVKGYIDGLQVAHTGFDFSFRMFKWLFPRL